MPGDRGKRQGLSPGLRVYLLTVAAISLVAVLVVLLAYSPGRQNSLQIPEREADSSVYSRLILPEDKRGLIAGDHVALRSRRREWTREQVDRFWIPPESIVIELLKQENDAVLEEIFESVP